MTDRRWTRVLCLALCALFCVTLFAGCAAAKEENIPKDAAATKPAQGLSGGAAEQTNAAVLLDDHAERGLLTGTDTGLTEVFSSYIRPPAEAGGRLWYLGENDAEENAAEQLLASTALDGSDLQVQKLILPAFSMDPEPVLQEYEYLFTEIRLVSTAQQRPMALHTMSHDAFVFTDAESGYYTPIRQESRLCTIDSSGKLSEGILLDLPDANGWMYSLAAAAPDSLWFLLAPPWLTAENAEQAERLVGISTADGSRIADLPLPEHTCLGSVQVLADGRLALLLYRYTLETENDILVRRITKGSFCLRLLSPFAQPLQLSEPLYLPEALAFNNSHRLLWQPLNARTPQAVLWNDQGLYLWDVDTNTLTQKYNWNDYGGSLLLHDFAALYCSDGRYIYREQKLPFENYRQCTIAPAGGFSGEGDDRTVITVGTVEPSALTEAVDRFNAASADYRVELIAYTATQAQAAGLDGAVDLLRRDILQGAVPDILVLSSSISPVGLLNKGLFTDLYPFLDADPDLARDDFVQGVLTACETGGQLTTIAPYFNVYSAAGSAARLGSDPGWSWAEFEKATANCRVPYYGLNRQTALWWQVQMGGSRFIDHAAGRAHFDSDAFVQLLESCAAYPEQLPDPLQDPKPDFADGSHLLQFLFVVSFGDVPRLTYQFDGPIVYKGLPSDEGSGSAFTANLQLGITTACTEPDAAWQFLRTLLLPEFQNALTDGFTTYLPLRRDSLERLAGKYQKPRTNGVAVPAYLGQPTQAQLEYFGRALTQEETDAILELIETTDTLFQYDGTVMDILMEESLNYYNGQCTAEAAAQYIQNRVQLYLDERA